MTVAELIEKLKEFPPDMRIVVRNHDSLGDYFREAEQIDTQWAKDIDEMVTDKRSGKQLHHKEDLADAKEGDDGAYPCVVID